MKSAREVYRFWFEEYGPDDWYGGKAAFDKVIAERFSETHVRVAAGEAFTWRATTQGRVAEIIVLDQFSRQLFRGDGRAFATDAMALTLAQEAVAGGHDQAMNEVERQFGYMPYMHSESLAIHEEAVKLFAAMGNEKLLDYEMRHKQVIERFDRYPKRNAALDRISTAEELAYIEKTKDSMF